MTGRYANKQKLASYTAHVRIILSQAAINVCTQAIKKLLIEDKVDINARNDIGEAPIHTLVRNAKKDNTEKFETLWNFLVYCNGENFDINIKSKNGGDTALHLAAEVRYCCIACTISGLLSDQDGHIIIQWDITAHSL